MDNRKKIAAIAGVVIVIIVLIAAIMFSLRGDQENVGDGQSSGNSITNSEEQTSSMKWADRVEQQADNSETLEDNDSLVYISWLDKNSFVGGYHYRGLFEGWTDSGRMIVNGLLGTHPSGVFPTIGVPDDIYTDGFQDSPLDAQLYDYVEVVTNSAYELIGFRNFGNNVQNARFLEVEAIEDLESGKVLTCNNGEFQLLVLDTTPVYWGFGYADCGNATFEDIEVGDYIVVLIDMDLATMKDGTISVSPIEVWLGKDLS